MFLVMLPLLNWVNMNLTETGISIVSRVKQIHAVAGGDTV
jgi:hypothetical protein